MLSLMAEGKSNKAIGESLWISEHTVEKHVNSIFAKLELSSSPDEHRRVLAVLSYLERR
ncbi:MAG: response regulator transcription factor [Gaiellaceae bacterium]